MPRKKTEKLPVQVPFEVPISGESDRDGESYRSDPPPIDDDAITVDGRDLQSYTTATTDETEITDTTASIGSVPIKPRKARKPLTEAQKALLRKNLEKARAARAQKKLERERAEQELLDPRRVPMWGDEEDDYSDGEIYPEDASLSTQRDERESYYKAKPKKRPVRPPIGSTLVRPTARDQKITMMEEQLRTIMRAMPKLAEKAKRRPVKQTVVQVVPPAPVKVVRKKTEKKEEKEAVKTSASGLIDFFNQ